MAASAGTGAPPVSSKVVAITASMHTACMRGEPIRNGEILTFIYVEVAYFKVAFLAFEPGDHIALARPTGRLAAMTAKMNLHLFDADDLPVPLRPSAI